jgi:IS5 family transposase
VICGGGEKEIERASRMVEREKVGEEIERKKGGKRVRGRVEDRERGMKGRVTMRGKGERQRGREMRSEFERRRASAKATLSLFISISLHNLFCTCFSLAFHMSFPLPLSI